MNNILFKKPEKSFYIFSSLFLLSIIYGYYNPPTSLSGSSIVGYDWCYPSCDDDDVQSSFKFSSDNTFTFSTIMAGGMTRWGKWEKIGDNTFRLTTTRISTNSSNDRIPKPQTIKLISDKKLKVGGTTYVTY